MRAQCFGPNAAGGWSGYGSEAVRIVAPPAPSAPGGVSADWNAGNAGGVVVVGRFSAVGGATSYEWGARFVLDGTATVFNSYTGTTSGVKRMPSCGTNERISAGSFRVRSNNGWSWSA